MPSITQVQITGSGTSSRRLSAYLDCESQSYKVQLEDVAECRGGTAGILTGIASAMSPSSNERGDLLMNGTGVVSRRQEQGLFTTWGS
jgi:hypothetical protein